MITFDFNHLERSMSRSLRFGRLIFPKGADSGHVLLIKHQEESHMGSLTAPSHLTLSDLERIIQGHSDFEVVYLVKEQNYAYVTIKH